MRRARRTQFWCNGPEYKNLKEILASNADVVQLDLEQHVPAPNKQEARDNLANILKTVDFGGKEKAVRINDPNTEEGIKDLEQILPCHPDSIRIPKVENVETVKLVDEILTKFEKEHNIPLGTFEIGIGLETPIGLMRGYEIFTASKRVTTSNLGAGDLTTSMHIKRCLRPGNTQLLYAKQKLVMDALAAGIDVADTNVTTNNPAEKEAFLQFVKSDTELDKEMGFTGRSVGMIEHIDIINDIYTPSDEEVKKAYHLVEVADSYYNKGEKHAYLDGKWIDPDVYNTAKWTIETIEAIRRKEEGDKK